MSHLDGALLLKDLQRRGLLFQSTLSEVDLLEFFSKPQKFYVGFDPTYHDLHLGSYAVIAFMKRLEKAGHTPYVLVGGATGLVGDPSGKSKERPFLDEAHVRANADALKKVLSRFLQKARFVNNLDWFGKISLIEFLRDVGKDARLGTMLSRESVKLRLGSEEGMSFTELSYQLLQGYDFVYLHEKEGVTLQCGGSDQWGNMISGVELGSKRGYPLQLLTFPLITRADGRKFGKSEEGTSLWISDFEKGPYAFYQYLLLVPDDNTMGLLAKLTFLSMEEIESAALKMSHPNELKKLLASEVVRDIFGEEGLSRALAVTRLMAPGTLHLPQSVSECEELEKAAPELVPPFFSEWFGKPLVELLVSLKIFASKGEATRLIEQKGLFVLGEPLLDGRKLLSKEDLLFGRYLPIAKGKKAKYLLVLRD